MFAEFERQPRGGRDGGARRGRLPVEKGQAGPEAGPLAAPRPQGRPLRPGWWVAPWLICGLLGGSWGCESATPATPVANAKAKVPLEVEWVSPEQAELVEHEEFSGRLVAAEAVDIKARVSGPLEQILFRDGDDIEAGTPLFELDDRPYVAEQERAAASVRMQSARLDKLRRQERRSARLLETRSISQEDYDDIAFDFAEAEAGLAAAQAALRLAELNLGYTRISSRIAGRISRHLVDPGNLVKADETTLARVVDLDPIHAYFDVDERTVLRLQRLVQAGRAMSAREQEIPVEVRLADEDRATLSARFNFLDNEVDPDTGTLQARAELSNPARVLTPGLFVRLRVPIGEPQGVLLIPEEALASDQGERFVHVVTADNRVEHRRVTVGWREGGRRVIRTGLTASDRLIVTNLQRLRAGDEVKVKPTPLPDKTAGNQEGGPKETGRTAGGDKEASKKQLGTTEASPSAPVGVDGEASSARAASGGLERGQPAAPDVAPERPPTDSAGGDSRDASSRSAGSGGSAGSFQKSSASSDAAPPTPTPPNPPLPRSDPRP